MDCPTCARPAPDHARFCGTCGALLRPQESTGSDGAIRMFTPDEDRVGAPEAADVSRHDHPPRAVRAAVVAAAGLLVVGAVLGTAWLTGGTARPARAEAWRIDLATEPDPRFLESTDAGLPASWLEVGASVHTSTEQQVVTLDPATGRRRWQRAVSRPLYAVTAGDALVVPTDTGLVTFDASSGELLWRDAAPGASVPAASAGTLVLVRRDAAVGLDAMTGRQLWTSPLRGELGGLPILLSADADGTVVASALQGVRLVAIDARTGERRWSAEVDERIAAGPFVADGNVYVVDGAGTLRALSVETGAERWSKAGGDGSIAAGEGVAVRRSSRGDIVALDAGTGTRRWVRQSGPPSFVVGLSGGSVVLADPQGNLAAVDATTGAQRWERSSPRGSEDVEVGADAVYVLDRRGTVVAHELSTGEQRWQAGATSPHETAAHPAPVPAGDLLLVSTVGGALVAIEADSGRERWRFDPANVEVVLEGVSSGVTGTATLIGDRVAVASSRALYELSSEDGRPLRRLGTSSRAGSASVVIGGTLVLTIGPSVIGIDPDTWQLVWQYLPTAAASTVTPPTAVDGRVIVGADDGTLAALDPSTGEAAWELDIGTGIVARPAADPATVVVRTQEGDLRAFDVASGRARWRSPTSGADLRAPVLAGGLVHATEGSELIAISASSGQERWRRDPGEGDLTAPTVSEGAVLAGTASGAVVALSADSGETLWRVGVDPQHPVAAPPAVTDAVVYVVTDRGEVVALT